MDARPDIVLVHGGWADGSCWSGVIERLQADGLPRHRPAVPRSPRWPTMWPGCATSWTYSKAPTIVAGHSYGGHIVTALGTDTPNTVGLVYIAALVLVATQDQAIRPTPSWMFASRMGATHRGGTGQATSRWSQHPDDGRPADPGRRGRSSPCR